MIILILGTSKEYGKVAKTMGLIDLFRRLRIILDCEVCPTIAIDSDAPKLK